jgi:hypothetical protein
MTMHRTAHLGTAFVRTAVAMAALFGASSSVAADTGLASRAAVLTRVLSYERSFDDRVGPSVVIAIVYQPGDRDSEASAASWQSAFESLGNVRVKSRAFSAVKVPARQDAMTAAIEKDGVDVLFVPDSSDRGVPEVIAVARRKKVLSAGSKETYPPAGITLAVATDGAKVKLVVNLVACAAEGIKFSAQVLRLAEVIR